MAKVLIDIPDRYIEAVKGLMMMKADDEKDAKQLFLAVGAFAFAQVIKDMGK